VTRTKMEEFRRLAQECRATALILSTEQARAEMLAMADVCERVAAQVEGVEENSFVMAAVGTRLNEVTPLSSQATASPSMMQEGERRRANVSTISGKR